jgi:bacteriorhodopsin
MELKDIFGLPRTGFHAQRIPILDIALWDTVGTIVITIILVQLFAVDKSIGNTLKWILFAFILGFVLHYTIGVRTKMTVPFLD